MKTKLHRHLTSGVLSSLVLLAGSASAATVIYNEGTVYASLGEFPPIYPAPTQNLWMASNFVTVGVATGTYEITVNQNIIVGSSPTSDSYWVALYSNTGPGGTVHYSGTGLNHPNALITMLGGDSDPDSGLSFDYTATVNLTANTNYWVVVGTNDTDIQEYWPLFGRGNLNPPAGARVEGVQFSSNQGASWDYPLSGNVVHFDMRVSIDTAPVPEPSALLLGSLAGLGLLRRRRD